MAKKTNSNAPHNTSTSAAKRYDQLRAEIAGHDHAYYVQDKPTISDLKYDELFAELLKIEADYPELKSPASPSLRVGGKALDAFVKAQHRTPMLSLANTYSPEDLRDFDERVKKFLRMDKDTEAAIEYFCEPKLDGLALELVYENGLLVRALTRGDGVTGEDVTHNIRTIRSIPLHIKTDASLLEVRGEILINKKDFAELNEAQQEAGETPFANPRNAAAGTVRQLDPTIAAKRPLAFYAYALGAVEGFAPPTQQALQEAFVALGLPTVDEKLRRPCKGIEAVVAFYHDLENKREKLPFDIDGMVCKVNSFQLQQDLGFIARTPRWATAAKYKPQQSTTVVEDILIQVGRTGALTPVAQLHPVKVGGVTITNATLHNQEEISRKDIRIGDTVVIQRAGDVIPEVVEVVLAQRPKSAKAFHIPHTCPVCDSPAKQNEGEVILRCTNPLCPAIMQEALKHFAARRAMNIDKVGDKIIETFFQHKMVTKFSDFYRLKKEMILELDRQGEKSADNIIASINASKQTTLARLIFAFGIRFVGEQTAKALAEHFGTLDAFLDATPENLVEIPDIGPKVAESIAQWLENPQTHKEAKDLIKLGVQVEEIRRNLTGSLAGKSFVITGTLPVKRDDAKDRIEAAGGKVLSSVSKKLDYLVAGLEAGSKLEKAQSFGVQILDWAQLENLIKGDQ